MLQRRYTAYFLIFHYPGIAPLDLGDKQTSLTRDFWKVWALQALRSRTKCLVKNDPWARYLIWAVPNTGLIAPTSQDPIRTPNSAHKMMTKALPNQKQLLHPCPCPAWPPIFKKRPFTILHTWLSPCALSVRLSIYFDLVFNFLRLFLIFLIF